MPIERWYVEIEGFWSLLKRAWYGQHHRYQKGFTPLYVAEAVFKHNHRKTRLSLSNFSEDASCEASSEN